MRISAYPVVVLFMLGSLICSAAPTAFPYRYLTGDFGFVNKLGVALGTARYKSVKLNDFNYFIVTKSDGYKGIADSTGKEIVKPVYTNIETIIAGYFKVKYETGRYALVGPDGSVLTPFEYKNFRYAGCNRFITDNGTKTTDGLIDMKGKVILPTGYDGIAEFQSGRSVTTKYDRSKPGYLTVEYCIIDSTGKVLFTSDHKISPWGVDRVLHQPFFSGGKGFTYDVYVTNYLGSVLHRLKCVTGAQIIDGSASGNLHYFQCEDKYGYVNDDLQIVLPCIYDDATSFSNVTGLAFVKSDGTWYYINSKGEKVFDWKYDTRWLGAFAFSSRYRVFKEKDSMRQGVIDFTGAVVIPSEYEKIEIGDATRGYFVARKNQLAGIIDINQKVVVPFLYEEIDPATVDQSLFLVRRGEEKYYVDINGKEYRQVK
jgi:WG containing repeat